MSILTFTYEDICRLSIKDNKMSYVIREIGTIERECINDVFTAIVNSIISQQLSSKVANTIYERFITQIGIDAKSIYETDTDTIKSIGLSQKKAEYIKGVATAVCKKEIDLDSFKYKSNIEIINELTSLHGIGVWTAEMILIFSLKRPNVLSKTDYGIKKGIEYLYYDEVVTINQLKERYGNLCTLASLYLWEIARLGKNWINEKIKPYIDNK